MSYFLWDEGVSHKECQSIIDEYKDVSFKEGQTGSNDPKVRNNLVHWIETNSLIARAMFQFILEANNKYFKYIIDGYEQVQLSKYEIDGFYDWHKDAVHTNTELEPVRKLALSINLSDPESYEGGEFEFFDGHNKSLDPMKNKQGAVVVFDCLDWHRVKPVIKGSRYSLVMWAIGPRFK